MDCVHKQNNEEGVVWSDEDSLDHFLSCLTKEQQASWWKNTMDWSDVGHRCIMKDHEEEIFTLQIYTNKLRDQLERKD